MRSFSIFIRLITILCFVLILATCSLSMQEKATIKISIDPRMELLAAVQILSGYDEQTGLITKLDFLYKREVLEYFRPFKEHRAVQIFDQISGNFSYDAPPNFMLHLSNPPELQIEHDFTPYLIERAQGEANLQEFVQELQEFARDTKFMDFFQRHQLLYQSIEADIRNKLGDKDYISLLENYYGIHQNSYTIIPALLFHGGGFGPRISRPDGSLDIYYIGGLIKIENDQLVFQTEASLRDLAWHEFSHSFVNPLTDKNWKELETCQNLIDPILTFLNKLDYASWDACTNEHIVRAVTIRFAYREIGKEAGDKALKSEKLAGWFYLEPILTKLVEYEQHRQQYATFAEFFPEIVTEFKRLHEAKLGDDFYWMPYDGSINSILLQKKSLVVIVPTNESDKESEQRLLEI